MKTGVLIHGIEWASSRKSVLLPNGVLVEPFENSQVRPLYEHICATQNVDSGEPFQFGLCMTVPDKLHDELFPYFGGPDSIVSQLSNWLVITTGRPLGLMRVVISTDDFASCCCTDEIFHGASESAKLLGCDPDKIQKLSRGESTPVEAGIQLSDDDLQVMCKICGTFLHYNMKDITNHRILNAMDYMFYAWRSHSMAQVCINLAIVLETLFSPPSSESISKVIAKNASRVCVNNEEERQEVARCIGNFYSLRSKVVHGGSPDEQKLLTLTPKVFELTCRFLRRMLSDWQLTKTFGNERSWRKMTSTWLK